MPGIAGLPGLREARSVVSRTPALAREMWSRARASARRRHGGDAGPHQVAWVLVAQQAGRVGRLLPGAGLGAAEDTRAPAGGRARRAGRAPSRGSSSRGSSSGGSARRSGGGSRRGGRAGAVRPVAATSRQELYAMARDLGIEGRSRMSKGELAEAVRRATGGAVGGSSPARSTSSSRSTSKSTGRSSGTSKSRRSSKASKTPKSPKSSGTSGRRRR
ncbi:Rho termination factor N-terminal domain-containing protein [Actinomadura sp. NPDC047616]|uniref:Rho termination factor N-terminal domain-containing protein n=1 Tax=Actinomadura sp. NPDC047616 TaxID=3155914 RepID=UPI0033ED5C14